MEFKYIIKIVIIIFIFISFVSLLSSITYKLSKVMTQNNQLLEVVTIEGLTTLDSHVIVNKSDAFCETHRGSSGALDESCGKLTNNNCNSTSCCVWTSDEKCRAGGAPGPTFNTDSNGKTKSLDYYYFQNKCYGPGCSKVV